MLVDASSESVGVDEYVGSMMTAPMSNAKSTVDAFL